MKAFVWSVLFLFPFLNKLRKTWFKTKNLRLWVFRNLKWSYKKHQEPLNHLIGGKNCPPSFTVTSSAFSSSTSFTLFEVPGFSLPTPDVILFVSCGTEFLASVPFSGALRLLLLSWGTMCVASAPIGCNLSRVRALRLVQPPSVCTLRESDVTVVAIALVVTSEELCESEDAWFRDVKREVPRCLCLP